MRDFRLIASSINANNVFYPKNYNEETICQIVWSGQSCDWNSNKVSKYIWNMGLEGIYSPYKK